MAAPRTPMSSAKMNTGSSTMFITAPSSTENIALRAKPCAVTKEFMPVASRANTVPVMYQRKYSSA